MNMKGSMTYIASGLAVLIAAFQVYLGLNMESFGVGGLHTHITLAVILLMLIHVPFIGGEGLTKKFYLGLVGLLGIQGVIGLYIAFVQHIRTLGLIHHIFGWLILFGTIGGVILLILKK